MLNIPSAKEGMMPLSYSSETRQLEVVQCRETTADAAIKWAFVAMMLLIGVGMLISQLVPTYWDWKWRRKARKEGLTK